MICIDLTDWIFAIFFELVQQTGSEPSNYNQGHNF